MALSLDELMIKDFLEEFDASARMADWFPENSPEEIDQAFRAYFFDTQTSEYAAYSRSDAFDGLTDAINCFLAEKTGETLSVIKLALSLGMPISQRVGSQ
jgi:hypothetical protein